jgi:P pilus assembly protein, chaperone PapD
MARQLIRMLQIVACWGLLAPVIAGEFVVSPIRLDLGPGSRSGAITVRNEGTEKIGFQLEAMEWQQDASGQDQYLETRELVFFPKIMTVEGGQEGLIRIGTKMPVVQTEKTYRLFIQEMPGPTKEPEQAKAGKAQVNFLIRFGAPIFVAPVQPQDGLTVDSLSVVNSAISLSARNSGNRHQVIQGVSLKGADAAGNEVYASTLADRYLLSGTTKSFSATIPPAQCARVASLSVEIKTDKQSAARRLDVNPSMCR